MTLNSLQTQFLFVLNESDEFEENIKNSHDGDDTEDRSTDERNDFRMSTRIKH